METNINSNEVNLGMAVLSSFRGRHVDDLAWTTCANSQSNKIINEKRDPLPLITT